MENNNNGKGIFYGVIGIATLIVAIVGATFAYFSGTANSAEGAINITSYSGFNVSLVLNKIAPEGVINKMIPLRSNDLMSYALEGAELGEEGAKENKPCLDINGDQVCIIYEMTLTNTGPATDIIGYLEAEAVADGKSFDYEKGGSTTNNLRYALYTKDALNKYINTVTNAEGVDNTSKFNVPVFGVKSSNFVFGKNGADLVDTLSIPEGTAADPQVRTYYLVLWLEDVSYDAAGQDTGVNQNSDIGKQFLGKVTFNLASGTGNEGKIQATFESHS